MEEMNKNESYESNILTPDKRNKKKKKVNKAVLIFSTILGAVFLFALTVIITVNVENNKGKPEYKEDAVLTDKEMDGLSRDELEKKIKELEREKKELEDEVEKYKILAEQTTKAVSAPYVSSSESSNKSENKSDVKYYDSSKYYDEDYNKYTSDSAKETGTDKKNTDKKTEVTKPSENTKPSDNKESKESNDNSANKTSDNGL